MHNPAGFKAERILLVGLGKLTTAEVRKGAGAAVRFAKPASSRELTIAIPEGLDPHLPPQERWWKALISAISIRIPIVQTAKIRVSSNSVCLAAAHKQAALEAGCAGKA